LASEDLTFGDFGFLITDGIIDFLLGDAVRLDQFLVTRLR